MIRSPMGCYVKKYYNPYDYDVRNKSDRSGSVECPYRLRERTPGGMIGTRTAKGNYRMYR